MRQSAAQRGQRLTGPPGVDGPIAAGRPTRTHRAVRRQLPWTGKEPRAFPPRGLRGLAYRNAAHRIRPGEKQDIRRPDRQITTDHRGRERGSKGHPADCPQSKHAIPGRDDPELMRTYAASRTHVETARTSKLIGRDRRRQGDDLGPRPRCRAAMLSQRLPILPVPPPKDGLQGLEIAQDPEPLAPGRSRRPSPHSTSPRSRSQPRSPREVPRRGAQRLQRECAGVPGPTKVQYSHRRDGQQQQSLPPRCATSTSPRAHDATAVLNDHSPPSISRASPPPHTLTPDGPVVHLQARPRNVPVHIDRRTYSTAGMTHRSKDAGQRPQFGHNRTVA